MPGQPDPGAPRRVPSRSISQSVCSVFWVYKSFRSQKTRGEKERKGRNRMNLSAHAPQPDPEVEHRHRDGWGLCAQLHRALSTPLLRGHALRDVTTWAARGILGTVSVATAAVPGLVPRLLGLARGGSGFSLLPRSGRRLHPSGCAPCDVRQGGGRRRRGGRPHRTCGRMGLCESTLPRVGRALTARDKGNRGRGSTRAPQGRVPRQEQDPIRQAPHRGAGTSSGAGTPSGRDTHQVCALALAGSNCACSCPTFRSSGGRMQRKGPCRHLGID